MIFQWKPFIFISFQDDILPTRCSSHAMTKLLCFYFPLAESIDENDFLTFYCYCFCFLYNSNIIGIFQCQTFIITTFHLLLAYFNSDLGFHILIYIAMTTYPPTYFLQIAQLSHMNSLYKYISVSI